MAKKPYEQYSKSSNWTKWKTQEQRAGDLAWYDYVQKRQREKEYHIPDTERIKYSEVFKKEENMDSYNKYYNAEENQSWVEGCKATDYLEQRQCHKGKHYDDHDCKEKHHHHHDNHFDWVEGCKAADYLEQRQCGKRKHYNDHDCKEKHHHHHDNHFDWVEGCKAADYLEQQQCHKGKHYNDHDCKEKHHHHHDDHFDWVEGCKATDYLEQRQCRKGKHYNDHDCKEKHHHHHDDHFDWVEGCKSADYLEQRQCHKGNHCECNCSHRRRGATGSTDPGEPAGAYRATGLRGSDRNMGSTVLHEPMGATGTQGLQGPTGYTGPQGSRGIQGLQGPTGSPGFISPYAYIYNVGTQFITIETDIIFSNNGALFGSISHTPGSSTIVVNQTGDYFISFHVVADTANQFALFINGILVPGSRAATSLGGTATTGSIIYPMVAGDSLTVRNYSSTINPVVLASDIGGENEITNAWVIIEKIR